MALRKSKLPALPLSTKYPCCGGLCRFLAVFDVPRETYTRDCPRCGQRWEIERRFARQTDLGRVDVLEWTRDRHVNLLVHGRVAAQLKRKREEEECAVAGAVGRNFR